MSPQDKKPDQSGNPPPPPGPMTLDVAAQIVRDYGAVLQTSSTALGGIADVRELPYPKERIKEALIVALRSTTDKKTIEQLRGGYVFLADWQPGVGAEPVSSGFEGINPDDSTEEIARKVIAQSERKAKWAPVVAAESAALKAELQKLGLA